MKKHAARLKVLYSVVICFLFMAATYMIFPPTKVTAEEASNLGAITVGKTYYIRDHGYQHYLTVPAGATNGSDVTGAPFISDASTMKRQKWTVVSAGNGYYYLRSEENPAYCLDYWSSDGSTIKLYAMSNASASSQWKIILNNTAPSYYGGYRLVSKQNDARRLSIVSSTSATTTLKTESASIPIMQTWVFEEVMSTRNNAAPPTTLNGTYGTSGYGPGHYARDVAALTQYDTAKGCYPVYADRAGTATFWTNTNNNHTTRIGNFITIRHADGSGVLYAHLSDFRYYSASALPGTPNSGTYGTHYDPLKVGTRSVARGEYVGLSGASGSADGKHLHIEYYTNYDAVFGGTNFANTWVYSSSHSSVVRDPKNYMKFWYVA